ncbi:hypothetical protein BCR39DRAFT_588996 [Naematelia encephala]|uniref:FAD/NAD(P)-binding domain-containing protein n=1 Tax=Naematelia encephala TaxID=71784 RepID=A0A1Y2AZC1_9TREE|nr:hypothetical protein BCR39DRAFT_588996 [Naematelia encephala]
MSSGLKNVVIIGAGLGGTNAIEAIEHVLPATHRMVVITENEYAYFPLAALRAATVPGWEEKVLGDVNTLFPKGSRHVVLPGTKVLELKEHSVKVDKVRPGFEEEIAFDQLVYATGSTYAFPFRTCDRSKTSSEVQVLFRTFQAAIKKAESILIVGGGGSGVEFAGEIAAQYKGHKKITLAHTGALPLVNTGWKEKVGRNVQRQLKDMNVVIEPSSKVNTKGLSNGPIDRQLFDLSNGRTVEADFLIVAHGIKPRTELMRTFLPKALDRDGFVRVKPTLQVVSADGSLDHLFAVGDVNDADPTKQAVWADAHGPVVAANIAALASGRAPNKTYTSGTRLGVFSLGPSGGAGQIYFGWVAGARLTTMIKSKVLFTDEFKKNWNK